eukprot:g14.t1
MNNVFRICLVIFTVLVAHVTASFGTIHAVCELDTYETARGSISFFQSKIGGPVGIFGLIYGISPGLHGWHVHELPITDKENPCGSTGGHFNPFNTTHGAPDAKERHVGDLGNFSVDELGVGCVSMIDNVISLVGPPELSILNRSMVIHAGMDDLGLGGDAGSLASGNSGARIGCCVITRS